MKSLDLLLIKTTNDYLLHHVGHGETFAARVREAYEKQVPNGKLKWSRSEVPSTRFNSDYVKIKRYLDREQHLPASLVGPWLSVLPENIRRQVLAEFCEGFGQIITQARKNKGEVSDMAAFAKLMKEFGEACEALAPLLEDGKVTSDDGLMAIRSALLELGDVSSALETVRAILVTALPTGEVVSIDKKRA